MGSTRKPLPAVDNGLKTPTKPTKVKKIVTEQVKKKNPIRCRAQTGRLQNWDHTHQLPQAESRSKNGRVFGRTLINWSRPRMIEKVLLHLLYECEIRNINLPMDFVAHRLYPGATGDALRQRTERLRKELIAEGHLVPPKPSKKRTNLDPKIRGYIRKYPGDVNNILETREVLFTEPIEDAEFNDPTGFKLVHNSTSREKPPKPAATKKHQESEDSNNNTDSESSDEAEESGQDVPRAKLRTSARTRSYPKGYMKESSDDDDNEGDIEMADNEDYTVTSQNDHLDEVRVKSQVHETETSAQEFHIPNDVDTVGDAPIKPENLGHKDGATFTGTTPRAGSFGGQWHGGAHAAHNVNLAHNPTSNTHPFLSHLQGLRNNSQQHIHSMFREPLGMFGEHQSVDPRALNTPAASGRCTNSVPRTSNKTNCTQHYDGEYDPEAFLDFSKHDNEQHPRS